MSAVLRRLPRRFNFRLASAWTRFLSSRNPWIPAAAAGVHLALVLWTHFSVLHAYPLSGDEYAMLVSAQIFSHGELSVPSPPAPRFFDVVHVVNDGKFYGKYAPGWPALLSLGFGAGRPWLVNPLLGAAVLLAIYALARRHFRIEAANISLLLLVACPWFVFQDASYFAHTSCLLAIVVFLDLALGGIEGRGGTLRYAGLGLAAGAALAIRAYTTIAMLAIPSAFLVAAEIRRRDPRATAKNAVAALLPFAVVTGLVLAYNHAQTGSALLSPFEKYSPVDHPALPAATIAAWMERARTHLLLRVRELNVWAPLLPVLFALGCWSQRRDAKVRILAASALTLLVAYYFYWAEGGTRYGPRYVFEAAGALTVVGAVWISGLRRASGAVVALVLVLDVVSFAIQAPYQSALVRQSTDLFRKTARAVKAPALVFLRTCPGRALSGTCARNGTDFRAPILYVIDRGDLNDRLFEEYPDRNLYVYERPPDSSSARIVPYTAPLPKPKPGP